MSKFKIHSKLKTELFIVAIHKGLNKNQVSPTSKVMSGKFVLASGKCQGILFCPVCMNPVNVILETP